MFRRPGPARRPRAPMTAVIVVAVVLGGVGTSVAAAYAVGGTPTVDMPETGTPGRLVLSSAAFESDMGAIAPGDPVFWQVDARLSGETRAALALQVQTQGELAERTDGLRLQISECDSAWVAGPTAPVCPGGSRIRLPPTTARELTATGPTVALSDLVATGRNHLLIELAVEDSPASRADATLMGATGSIGLRLTASDIDVEVEPTPTPSPTPSGTPGPTPTAPGTSGPGGGPGAGDGPGSGSGAGVEGISTEAERQAQLRRDAAALAERERAAARARALAATGGTILVPLLFGSAILVAGLVLTLRFGRSTADDSTATAGDDADEGSTP